MEFFAYDNPAVAPFKRYRSIVDDWESFVQTCVRPLPLTIWTNTLRTTPGVLQDWLAEENLSADAVSWYEGAFKLPPNLSLGNRIPYLAGLYHIQEEVSLIPALLLAPQPGERILDLCAAPGNKTAQIATFMQNQGVLVANDRNEQRLHVLRTTLARLGIMNVSTTQHDAAAFPCTEPRFDGVLADVPCSCEGTSRKQPGVLERASEQQSSSLATTQLAILKKSVEVCKPGGRIVYATCTYAPEENEMVIDALLKYYGRDRVRLAPAHIPSLHCAQGISTWNGKRLAPDLPLTMRIWPHQNDSGGFFVAVLEKQA